MKRCIALLFVMLACQFCLVSISLSAQEPLTTYKALSATTYESVLDTVFERNDTSLGYDFIIRFEPSDAPESQLFIKRSPSKTQVIEYASLSGNIYTKLDNILRYGGKEDAVEMAKQIQVKKKIVEVPAAQANQWWSDLPGAMTATIKLLQQHGEKALKGVGTITLDGTFYELWYNQVEGHVFVRVLDQEVRTREVTGNFALVRWMNTVRLDVEKPK